MPADLGDSAHEAILKDFREAIPKLEKKLKRRGIPGVFLDLEPHVKGGGQFGGFHAVRTVWAWRCVACVRCWNTRTLGTACRDFQDICDARGF